MDFIQQLRVFVSVADSGSFTRAADALRMARPSVTHAIADLETDVGARLLHRTTRRSTLTPEGQELYERATNLLGDVEDARNLFGGPGDQPRGRLRIDVPVSLARALVVPRLLDFNQRFPEIQIELGVSDRAVDLVADGVDCVLRLGELELTSMISRRVGSVAMVTCAAPAYLEARGAPQSLEALEQLEGVGFSAARDRRVLALTVVDEGHPVELKLRSSIQVNEAAAYIECGVAGFGVIQPPLACVADFLADGRLVEVLPASPAAPMPLSILYPNRQHLAPQVRAFISWITTIVAEADGRFFSRS